MFKKILITFILCMSVFSVVAFADTVPLFDVPNKDIQTVYKSEFEVLMDGNYYVRTFYHDYPLTYDSSSQTFTFTGTTYFYAGNSLLSTYEKGQTYRTGSTLRNVSINNKDGGVIPPTIPPTAKQAIQGIAPQLLKQSKNLLPVGVILLSTILGVSLVPRLVRSFL